MELLLQIQKQKGFETGVKQILETKCKINWILQIMEYLLLGLWGNQWSFKIIQRQLDTRIVFPAKWV